MDIIDIAISSIQFLSLREKILLRKNIDSLHNLCILSRDELSSIIRRPISKAFWNGDECAFLAEKSLRIMDAKGIEGVVYGSPEYPVMLSTIKDAPYAFFFMGCRSCLLKKCVSIVGTRRICGDAAKATHDFACDAASDGLTVVSGLANGIDTFAHKGALDSGKCGSTVAVLPSGIDTIVPYGNKSLAFSILKNGGLIASEYIPGTPCDKFRFVMRNRIIAALSSCTVVMQAPKGSGALITADFAIGYDRDLIVHEAAFCEEARKIADREDRLAKKNARSLSQFIEDGAAVVGSYAEYVSVMKDPPGMHSCVKWNQLEFDF